MIYRGTRDGFTYKEFREKVGNEENTIHIINNELGRVFGGFMSKKLDSFSDFAEDEKAFVFSLTFKTKAN